MSGNTPDREDYLLDLVVSCWIAEHESLRLTPYRCSAGKVSIGFGRNIEERGISKEEAYFMLRNDVALCIAELSELFWFNIQPNGVKKALINMCYNLGLPKLVKFEKMIGALRRKDYDRAAKEALDSLWAKQVGKRAQDIANVIRKGK